MLHPPSLIPHPSSFIPHPSSLIIHPSSFVPHLSSPIPHFPSPIPHFPSPISHPPSPICHPPSPIPHPSSLIPRPFLSSSFRANRPHSYLSRTANWDAYPTSRWADPSSSPPHSFGPIPSLQPAGNDSTPSPSSPGSSYRQFLRRKARTDKLRAEWAVPIRSEEDVAQVGSVKGMEWHELAPFWGWSGTIWHHSGDGVARFGTILGMEWHDLVAF